MTTITITSVGLIYIPSWTTSTNLGPLPTTSFPPDCLSSLWDFNTPALGLPWTQMTQGCAISTCCPYGNFYTEPWAWMTSYYSPDYNCPDTTGAFYGNCFSALSTPTSAVVMDNIFDQKTLSTKSWTLSGNSFSWQAVYPIQVRARATDSQPTPTTDTTSSITSSVLTTSPNQSSESKPKPQLSTGALVGIVIAGTCSTIGLCLIIGFLIRRYLRKVRRRRDQMNAFHQGIEGHLSYPGIAERSSY
ncbi:hypothetical protein TWF694_003602 [Orbilia ellipsospora]|uniref:Uncharacterized protein n=1 Tax=Orbilia ellipsospora TaxID=2528407 RepID=A0AAV9WZW7_9PEZI